MKTFKILASLIAISTIGLPQIKAAETPPLQKIGYDLWENGEIMRPGGTQAKWISNFLDKNKFCFSLLKAQNAQKDNLVIHIYRITTDKTKNESFVNGVIGRVELKQCAIDDFIYIKPVLTFDPLTRTCKTYIEITYSDYWLGRERTERLTSTRYGTPYVIEEDDGFER